MAYDYKVRWQTAAALVIISFIKGIYIAKLWVKTRDSNSNRGIVRSSSVSSESSCPVEDALVESDFELDSIGSGVEHSHHESEISIEPEIELVVDRSDAHCQTDKTDFPTRAVQIYDKICAHQGLDNSSTKTCFGTFSRNLSYGGLEWQEFINLLTEAKSSIQLCMSVLGCSEIVDILLECHDIRGIQLRFITNKPTFVEKDEREQHCYQIKRLLGRKVIVKCEEDCKINYRYAIVDDSKLILCSMNWNEADLFRHSGYITQTKASCLVDAFLDQFNKIWLHDAGEMQQADLDAMMQASTSDLTKNHRPARIREGDIELYFSPQEPICPLVYSKLCNDKWNEGSHHLKQGCWHPKINKIDELYGCKTSAEQALVNSINFASSTIDLCVFRLTYIGLTRILVQAKKKGLCVRVLVDPGVDKNQEERLEELNQAGAQVKKFKQDAVKNKPGSDKDIRLMHHKYVIIDSKQVFTGSMNWTENGICGSQELLMKLTGQKPIIELQKNFDQLWQKGTSFRVAPQNVSNWR